MPENMQPKASEIDAAQRKLDSADGATDRKISTDGQTSEELTATYITRVNAVQSKLHSLSQLAATHKDAHSPHWQGLERARKNVERTMTEGLSQISPETMSAARNNFAAALEEALTQIDKADDGVTLDKADAVPKGSGEIFNGWNVAESQREKIGAAAEKNYGADTIRTVHTRMSALNQLPPEYRTALFGENAAAVLPSQVAGQMANVGPSDSLPEPLNFLLQTDIVAVIEQKHQEQRDALHAKEEELSAARTALKEKAKTLGDAVKEGKWDEQKPLIDELMKARQELAGKTDGVNAMKTVMRALDLSLTRGRATQEQAAGHSVLADRLLVHAWEREGGIEGALPDEFKQEGKAALDRLSASGNLTEQEKLLFGNSPDAALIQILVKHQKAAMGKVDILDQVRVRNPILLGERFDPREEEFRRDNEEIQRRMNEFIRPEDRILNIANPGHIERKMNERGFLDPDVMRIRSAQGALQEKMLKDDAYGTPVMAELRQADGSTQVIQAFRKGRGRNASIVLWAMEDITPEEGLNDQNIRSLSRPFIAPRINLLGGRTPNASMENEEVTMDKTTYVENGRLYRMHEYPIPNATEILNTRILTQSGDAEWAQLSSAAMEALGNTKNGVTVLGNRNALRRGQILSSDLRKGKEEEGYLSITTLEGTPLSFDRTDEVERDREENTHDVLRTIDRHPAIQAVSQKASQANGSLEHLQTLFSASQSKGAEKTPEFVSMMRNDATDVLTILQDPGLRTQLATAKEMLAALEKMDLGIATQGLEKELQQRVEAIDGMIDLVENKGVIDMLKLIRDKSRFADDSWATWIQNEGPKMVAAIAVAVAATIFVISTFGAGLVVIAGASTLGGMVGYQLEAEGIRSQRQNDQDVLEGRATYTKGSLAGDHMRRLQNGEKITLENGQEVDPNFLRDVASPYAREYIIGFATTLATMGVGKAVSARISQMMQGSKWVEALGNRSPIAQRVMERMSGIAGKKVEDAVVKQFLTETAGEFADEGKEAAVEKALGMLDSRLGACGSLLLAIAGGLRPISMTKAGGGVSAVLHASAGTDVVAVLSRQGFDVQTQADGTCTAVSPDGNTSIQVIADQSSDASADAPEKGRKKLTPDEAIMKQNIMNLPDTEEGLAKRREGAAYIMKQKFGMDLTDAQLDRLLEVHSMEYVATDATQFGELRAKLPALMEGGVFNIDQARYALDMGICGSPPPPPAPRKKNAFGVPPPPPAPNRKNAGSVEAARKPLPQPNVLEKVSVTLAEGLQATDRATKQPMTVKPGTYQAMITKDGTHVILDSSGPVLRIYEVQSGTIFEATKAATSAAQPQLARNIPPPPSVPNRAPNAVPPPPAVPNRAPRMQDAVNIPPTVQGNILKAASLGLESPNALPASLTQELAGLGNAPVMVHNHFTYAQGVAKDRTLGYATVVNKQSVETLKQLGFNPRQNRDIQAMTLGNESEIRLRNKYVQFLQRTRKELDFSHAIESVHVMQEGKDMAILRYDYFSMGYKDTAGRHGTDMVISIVLPLEKAKAIQKELMNNPDAVRTFFIGAAQTVDKADYVWSQRVPNYSDIRNRRLLFTQEDGKTLTVDALKQTGNSWSRDAMTAQEANAREAVEKNLDRASQIQRERLQPSAKPEPPKGLWEKLFG